MAAPQLRLEVSLNLAGFRTEVQKLTNIAQSEFVPKINIKFNRRTLDAELNNLQAAIRRRVYRIEIGGNIDSLPKSIKALKEQLSSLESFKIDLGIGAVKSLSKKDASKINSDIRAQVLGEQKKIYVPVSIKPSIAKKDVLDFKNAVQSKLSGITVKVKADLESASIRGGAKNRSDIEADVRRGFEMISEIGAQRMARGTGGVTEAARREQLRQSLTSGGFDVGGLKDIGKQLGVTGAGRFKNANNLIEKIVADASIEMVKKYLDPQAVMRNPDRSGLGKVLDTFARGVFNMLGMDPASMLQQVRQQRLPASINWQATVAPSQRPAIGPSSTGRLLPGAATPSALPPSPLRGLLPERALSAAYREAIDKSLQAIISRLSTESKLPDEAGKLGPTIQQMRQQLFSSVRVAEVRVREIFDIVGDFDSRQKAAGQARLDKAVMDFVKGLEDITRRAILRGGIRQTNISDLGRTEQLMLPSGQPPLMLPSAGGTTAGLNRARITTGAQLGQQGFKRAPSMPPPSRREAPVTSLPPGYFESVNKYSQALNLGRAATDNFRASQIPFLGGLKNIAGEFGEATKQVLLYGTAYKGLAFITSLPGQILGAAKSQQQFNNAMQVATQASGSYAKELLFVDNVQRAFGLDLETTRSGFTRLYASMSPAGFDSGSIEKLFVGISSAMASLQLTPDKAERVIYAFGQMASKGQVMSEELKGQLGDVLPGALAIFASAAGRSIKEFNKEIEDGVYSGAKFRDLMSKVTDELITRFGSGASAAGRSLQGLINIVKGDFTRTLESFAPLANSAAEAILKPLGGALRQLSVATKLATGERGRVSGQVTKQQQVVQELGAIAAAERGGPNEAKALEQYKGAAQSLEALNIQLENLNELAKDPAIAQQAEDIKAFTNEIGKAAAFVKNFAAAVGGVLSPVLNFLGTNLTSVIATVATLVFTFQGARLALIAFAGVMTVVKGVTAAIGFLALIQQVGSFSAALATSGTVGKTVAAIYTSLGIGARAGAAGIVLATGATISFKAAIIALMSATGLGLLIAAIGTVGAAFLAMGDNAKQAADDAKQAAKDMAEAARTGNVPQVEAAIRQASASQELIKEGKSIVKRGQIGVPLETLDRRTLSENDKAILQGLGLSLPDGAIYRKDLLEQINKLEAINNGVLKGASSRLALAKKQEKRIGLGIPNLGLQGTEKPEDPNAEKAAQRGKILLDAIEQREEAIADARRQREEKIAQIRTESIEGIAKIEQSLADQRQKIAREIAQINRRSADESADIERQIRIARGEDRGLVEGEQRIVDISREGRDERLALSERIADEEKEQARSIADFQKKIAKELREADQAHTKKMGDIQRNYAKQIAKLIEEGSGKGAKKIEAAAKLYGLYLERASLQQQRIGVGAVSIPEPIARNGRLDYQDIQSEVVTPRFKEIDQQINKFRQQLQSQSIGEQFTKLLGDEGGYEDIAMTRSQAALIIKKLETEALSRNISSDAFVNALDQIGRFAGSPDESRRVIRNLMATPGAGIAVRSPGLLRNLATKQLGQDRANIQAEGVNPASLKKQIEPMLAIISQLQKDNLLRKNVSLGETREQIQKPLYGALMDWLKANLNNAALQKILKSTGFGQGVMESYGAKGILPKAAGFKPESFGVNLTPSALKEQREYEERQRYEATPAGKAEKAREKEYARRFRESLEKIRKGRQSEAIAPESFDVSKVATDFGTIAAASILRGVLDVSRVSDFSRSAQIAQAHNVKVGDRVGYGPESQRLYDASGATQTTQSRQALQEAGTTASRAKEVNKLRLAFEEITADSANYENDLRRQIDLLKEQAKLVRVGVRQSVSKELAELGLRKEKEIAQARDRVAIAQREGLATEEQAQALLDAKLLDIENLYQRNVAITYELEQQRSLLELMSESPQVVLNDALMETQKNFNALTNSGNIAVGMASAVGESFGSAFKGIVTGSMTAREALAGFFQSIADSFADMVAKMITEYLKMALIKGIMSLLPGLGAAAGGLSSAFGSTGPSFNAGAFSGPALSSGAAFGGAGAGSFSGAFGGGAAAFNPAAFSIPAFANGAIVTGPTLGLVGEGRYNEAVIPLPDGKSVPVQLSGGDGGSQINSNIVVNVNNGQAQSNATGSNSSELGRKIEGAVKQVIVGELRPGGLLASR